jgi:2-isopropylmalate synthase
MKKVQIFDTTLRDGEQTPGVNLNKLEKLEIAKQLKRLGADVIEVGFPVASPGDFESVKLIAQKVKGITIAALARAVKSDIDRAWEALQYAESPRIHLFIATSELHRIHKLNMSEEQVLERAVENVKYAKSLCPSVEFSPEDATRTEPEFLYRVLEAVIDAGADVVNIPDTVGYSVPKEFGDLIANIKRNVPNIHRAIISVHCHNDLGLAVANSLAALENGALQVETTINGLGERAGNASLEELVMALRTKSSYYGLQNNIITEQINNTSMLVKNLTGVEVQINKAIVGKNAFAHESGIHQHGVLNCRETYEIMTPESVGIKKSSVVLGKHSGSHAFEQRLLELGIQDLSEAKIKDLFLKFKELADRKKEVLDEDIDALARDRDYNMSEEGYNLEYFHISSGNIMVPTATVKLKLGEKTFEDAASGDGAVDSMFKAIERAINLEVNLKDYSLKSITSGKDALGEVTVKVEGNSKIYNGRGVSTDIIEASAKAYVNAINRMLYFK